MSKAWGGRRAQRARARLAPDVAAGRAVCRRCGLPIKPGQEWDVGHVSDLVTGGHVDGPTRPEHARKADCPKGGNRSAGATLGNMLRAERGPRTRPW